MISDMESRDGEFDGRENDATSDLVIEKVVEEDLVEKQDNKLASSATAYYYSFESEDSPFRTLFPDRYLKETNPEARPFLGEVLGKACPPEDGESEEKEGGEREVESPAPAAPEQRGGGKKPSASAPPSQSADAAAAAAAGEDSVSRVPPREGYVPVHRPSSRFLLEHLAECLLIPVEKTLNRKQLREQYITARGLPPSSESLDFAVGYIVRDPAGWAMPLTTDPEVLGWLKKQYPGYRSATEEDSAMFVQWRRAAAPQPTRPPRAVRASMPLAPRAPDAKALTSQMTNVDLFLDCVKKAGGWDKVTFVAFDAEYAANLPGGVPLPLEMAFLPVRRPGSGAAVQSKTTLRERHFFVHPGHIPNEQQAQYVSLSIHGIPYKDATFLRSDYAVLAKTIERLYLQDPNVILINKGSAADAQALRWLFGAALATAGTDTNVYGEPSKDAAESQSPVPPSKAASVPLPERAATEEAAEADTRGASAVPLSNSRLARQRRRARQLKALQKLQGGGEDGKAPAEGGKAPEAAQPTPKPPAPTEPAPRRPKQLVRRVRASPSVEVDISQIAIPALETVRCFDVSVLPAAIRRDFPSLPQLSLRSRNGGKPCWYHETMRLPGKNSEETAEGALHCACRDAYKLQRTIFSVLRALQPEKPSADKAAA